MNRLDVSQADRVRPLFAGWHGTLADSYWDGYTGWALAPSGDVPCCAAVRVRDFTYFAGEADASEAEELARAILLHPDDIVLARGRTAAWDALLQRVHEGGAQRLERYAFDVPASWDVPHLSALAAQVPDGYTVCPINKALFLQCVRDTGLHDVCDGFADFAAFTAAGGGWCAVQGDAPVAAAGPYLVYKDGIEIEIDVHEQHRRKGLARACAANLILECLQNGRTPHWDAANPASAALAGVLGYGVPQPYTAWLLCQPQ